MLLLHYRSSIKVLKPTNAYGEGGEHDARDHVSNEVRLAGSNESGRLPIILVVVG